MAKRTSKIYGFEDYTYQKIGDEVLDGKAYDYLLYYQDRNPCTHLIYKESYGLTKCYSYNYDAEFEEKPYEDHKELLKSGGKLYIHPDCKISRSLVFNKYTKVLNPFMADIVVLPTPSDYNVRITNEALFINEQAKCAIAITIDNANIADKLKTLEEGTILGNILTSDLSPYRSRFCVPVEAINSSELVYYGDMIIIPNTLNYLVDVFTGMIPLNKTVYEESLQVALGGEDNKLDMESLTSIHDMLNSTDSDTVGAGLKTLSMMDYTKCPNSVKYIISGSYTHSWKYNKAFNSTPVKFMFLHLYGEDYKGDLRLGHGNYSENIDKDDYNMIKDLFSYYDNADITNYSCIFAFMGRNNIGEVMPKIKKGDA